MAHRTLHRVAAAAVLTLATCAIAADAPAAPNHAKPLNEVKFTGITLADAIEWFRDATGANIDVQWKALEVVGMSKDTPVTLRLRNVPLRVALAKTLDAAAPGMADFYVSDNIITITSKQEADAKMVTRTVPVGDLLVDIPDFKGPSFDLNAATNQTNNTGGSSSGPGRSTSSSSAPLFTTDTDDKTKRTTKTEKAQDLIDTIQSTVRPDVWDVNGGKAHIKYYNGTLIITAPIAVQRLIAG
jgi:hypothetical protein